METKNSPCLCGATDCPRCYPRPGRAKRGRPEPADRDDYVDRHPRGSFWDRYDDNNYDGVCL